MTRELKRTREEKQSRAKRRLGFARAEMIAACVIVIALLTLGFVTFVALRGERAQLRAQQQAETMDRLRRSLWRMDSQLTSIIAREAARPPEQYLPFYPADRTRAPDLSEQFVKPGFARSELANAEDFSRAERERVTLEEQTAKGEGSGKAKAGADGSLELGATSTDARRKEADGRSDIEQQVSGDTTPEVLVPSELLNQPDNVTKLHFQSNRFGEFASPQVPRGKQRELSRLQFTTPYAIETSERKLEELAMLMSSMQVASESQAGVQASTGALSEPAAGAAQSELSKTSGDMKIAVGEAGTPSSGATGVQPDTARDGSGQYGTTGGKFAAEASESRGAETERADSQRLDQAGRQESTSKAREAAGNNAPSIAGNNSAVTSAPKTPQAKPASASAPPPGNANSGPADADYEARQNLARAASVKQEAANRTQQRSVPRGTTGDLGDLLMAEQFDDEQVPTVKTEPAVRQEGFQPQWIVAEGRMPELVFTRVVDGPWGTVQQGFWLDWPALESQLLSSVKDTAPGATLKPVLQKALPDEVMGRMLATVPAELVMPQPVLAGSAWTPLRTALVATWLLVLAAMLTLAWLARAADKLAENRGRFVTAVTHELRTPLTSFCMYSQMLADDMVTDEAARKEYARTLHGQSLRLSRIVESVLDYARLGRARRPVEATTVGAVRERIEPGLHAICERAGLQLVIEAPPAGWERAALRTDLDTIDRVLTNLVDNACKYGGQADEQHEVASEQQRSDRVVLAWRVDGQTLIAHVRDFGPGIPAADRERIFQAFERGSKHAGGATPGLGLGLALSHAMAQEIGGGLSLAHVGEGERGAAFELKLKLYS